MKKILHNIAILFTASLCFFLSASIYEVQAFTAQEQARINASVDSDPLIIKLTGDVQKAYDFMVIKDREALAAKNAYDITVQALADYKRDETAALRTPDPDVVKNLQDAIDAADIFLTQKNTEALNAHIAYDQAVADLAQGKIDVAKVVGDAITNQATGQSALQAGISSGTGATQGVLTEALTGLDTTAQQGVGGIKEGESGATSVYNGSTAGQVAPAVPLPTNQEQELIDRLQNGCGNLITDFMGCVSVIPYYIIYKPASWLLIISSVLFDTSIALSIDSNFVNQQFVNDLWKVVRDFSNMLFIFILLYTGIQTILGAGTNWQKTVLNVIGIALVINFSLFFTKVIIDTGNILAVGVYQAMGSVKDPGSGSMLQSFGGIPAPEERDLSGALVASFAPQKFLSKAGSVPNWNAVVIFIVAAIVNLFAAYVFLQVALIFIGRLLAFWLLMIVSPLAFLTIAFPALGQKTKLSFSTWLNLLVSQSFVAPVFLFLIYLLIKIIGANGGIMNSFIH